MIWRRSFPFSLQHNRCSAVQALLAHSQSQLPTMEPQGLANTAWAVSRLGVVPDPVWLAVLLEQTSAKMADMSAQVCAVALRCACKGLLLLHRSAACVIPHVSFASVLFALPTPHSTCIRTPSPYVQELSNVASGLARLGARPDAAWLTTLTQASTQAMPSSNSHNLSSMALALVAFR